MDNIPGTLMSAIYFALGLLGLMFLYSIVSEELNKVPGLKWVFERMLTIVIKPFRKWRSSRKMRSLWIPCTKCGRPIGAYEMVEGVETRTKACPHCGTSL